MYTINIRGKQNPKDTKMVKLEIIFFKTGYARVPKVINITGLLKDWDVKSQSFRVGSAEATTKNKLLFDLRTKYLHVADTWEMEGRNWSPVQLSHCFDEIKAAKPEVKVKSVQQMIDYLEETFKNKKRIRRLQRKNMKKPFPLISLRILQKSFFLTLRFGLKKEVSEMATRPDLHTN